RSQAHRHRRHVDGRRLHRRVRARRPGVAARHGPLPAGVRGRVLLDGALAWLVAGSPVARRGSLIGRAFATSVAGALFGPVLGGIASVLGIGWTFGAIGAASLGLAAAVALMPAERRETRQGPNVLVRAVGDHRVQAAAWF